MPEPQRYLVHEAVLSPRPEGSVWVLTLRPVASSGDASSPEDDEEVVIAVSPERIDEMEFGVSYTLEEMGALAED